MTEGRKGGLAASIGTGRQPMNAPADPRPQGQLPEPCTCDMQNICPEHGALGYERERMAFLEHMVDSAHDVLWSVAGQLAGFTEEYRDPDGNDCKVAVAHVIAQDIEKFMESGAAHAK